MNYTTNFNLRLPERNEQFNLDDWNDNTTSIDSAMQTNKTNISNNATNITSILTGLSTINTSDTSSIYYKLMKLIYPVGSIYWSSKSENPANLFGGTWVRIKDKFLWAMGDEDIPNSIGGAKTVTLKTTDLPDHHHIVNINDPGHKHSYSAGTGSDTSAGDKTNKVVNYDTKTTGSSYTGITASATSIRNTLDNAFTQTDIDKMPPFICKYCWQRTA